MVAHQGPFARPQNCPHVLLSAVLCRRDARRRVRLDDIPDQLDDVGSSARRPCGTPSTDVPDVNPRGGVQRVDRIHERSVIMRGLWRDAYAHQPRGSRRPRCVAAASVAASAPRQAAPHFCGVREAAAHQRRARTSASCRARRSPCRGRTTTSWTPIASRSSSASRAARWSSPRGPSRGTTASRSRART